VSDFDETPKRKKTVRKITPQRLKNIALYYLKRFESSRENLRSVLRRRIDEYARTDSTFDKSQVYECVEEILNDFERLHYLDDARYARLKIQNYLAAGKPERYIKIKLRQKGIDEKLAEDLFAENDYDPLTMALQFARKKKIGPFRADPESIKANRQKDLAALIRAGFDYETALDVCNTTVDD
jgi:regulatory protein